MSLSHLPDRRQFYRWNFHIPCRYIWQNRTRETRTCDISFGGVCLQGLDFPPVGSRIILEFDSQSPPIRFHAIVIHKRTGDLVGCEFDSSPEDNCRRLRSTLIDHAARKGLTGRP